MLQYTLRSWVDPVPFGKAHVVDLLPRLIIANYDYRPLARFQHADQVVVIEWDVAVDPGQLACFCKHAAEHPARVLAAPYLIGDPAHRNWVHRDEAGHRVVEGAARCHSFGFGLTALPMVAVRAFCETWAGEDKRMTDSNFSAWWGRGADLDWSVRPVHLHL